MKSLINFYFPNILKLQGRSYFSSNKKNNRVKTYGFTSSDIEDFRHLSYTTVKSIKFIDGKYLIYRNERSTFKPLYNNIHWLTLMGIIAVMKYEHAYYDLYPILKHAYIVFEVLLAWRILGKARAKHPLVKQIYLLEGGKATEIVYQNAIRRKMFREPLTDTFYNSIFVNPEEHNQEQTKPFNYEEFPKTVEQFNKIKTERIGQCIIKYFKSYENWLAIPANPVQIDDQIFVQIFNGKIIISSN